MIIGHKKQLDFLERILRAEQVPQAYLFVGPESVGKFMIAKIFAESLVAGQKKLETDYLEKVIKNQDVEILSPETIEKKGVIKIKDFETKTIREVQKNLSLYPAIGRYRVLLINDAQKMNSVAQNSLLKTLEEPNESSIIILVANQEEAILETIKSRCQKISFNLVGLKEINESLLSKVDNELANQIAIYSMGRPGEAIRFLQKDASIEKNKQIIEDLKKIATMNMAERIFLAEEYSKNLPETKKKIELWIWFLRFQVFKDLQNEKKLKTYYKLISKMETTLEKLSGSGLNHKLILENLFLNL